jgi:hypothetical protein
MKRTTGSSVDRDVSTGAARTYSCHSERSRGTVTSLRQEGRSPKSEARTKRTKSFAVDRYFPAGSVTPTLCDTEGSGSESTRRITSADRRKLIHILREPDSGGNRVGGVSWSGISWRQFLAATREWTNHSCHTKTRGSSLGLDVWRFAKMSRRLPFPTSHGFDPARPSI